MKMKFSFALSFGLATTLMFASSGAMVVILKKCGVNL